MSTLIRPSERYKQLLSQRPMPLDSNDFVYINPYTDEWDHASLDRVHVLCDEEDPSGDRHLNINLAPPGSDYTRAATFCIPYRVKRDDLIMPPDVQAKFDRQEARLVLGLKKQ